LDELADVIPIYRQLNLDWQRQVEAVRSPAIWARPDATPEGHQAAAKLKALEQAKLDELTVRRTPMRERLLTLVDEALDLAERPDVNLDSTPLIRFREAWCDKPPGYADGTPEAAQAFVERLKRRVRQSAANRGAGHDAGAAPQGKSPLLMNYSEYANHSFGFSDAVAPLLDPASVLALDRPDATPDDVKLRDGVTAAKATAAAGRQFLESRARLRQALKNMHEAETVRSDARVAESWGDMDATRNAQLRRLRAVLQWSLIRPGYLLVHIGRRLGLADRSLLPLLRQIEASPPTLDCISNEAIDAEVARIVDSAAARVGQPTQAAQPVGSANATAKSQASAGSRSTTSLEGPTPSSQENVDADKPDPETGLPPSRMKARAVYEYALANIPGAAKMTRAELYDAIRTRFEAEAAKAHGRHAEEVAKLRACLPPNAETFGKYLRDAGIKVYDNGGNRKSSRSICRHSEI
jgi:hypothetical protein